MQKLLGIRNTLIYWLIAYFSYETSAWRRQNSPLEISLFYFCRVSSINQLCSVLLVNVPQLLQNENMTNQCMKRKRVKFTVNVKTTREAVIDRVFAAICRRLSAAVVYQNLFYWVFPACQQWRLWLDKYCSKAFEQHQLSPLWLNHELVSAASGVFLCVCAYSVSNSASFYHCE